MNQIATDSSIEAFINLVLFKISITARGRYAKAQLAILSDNTFPGFSANQSWHFSLTQVTFVSSVLIKGQILFRFMGDLHGSLPLRAKGPYP
jgi:hypothetical protein